MSITGSAKGLLVELEVGAAGRERDEHEHQEERARVRQGDSATSALGELVVASVRRLRAAAHRAEVSRAEHSTWDY